MIDEISAFIKQHWNQWFSGWPAPRYIRYLKTTSSLISRSYINLFIFWEDNPEPTLLLRIPRDPESIERLLAQDANFRKIKSLLNDTFISHLPEEFGIYEVNNIHFSVSLINDLPPMIPSSTESEQIINEFKDSLEWLLAFHEATTSHFTPYNTEIINSTILKVVDDGQRNGMFSPIENSLIRNIVEKARQSIGLLIPIGWIHGDFWPRNILVDHSTFIVIDWEHCKDNALPFLDLFIFCLGYGLCLEPAGDNKSLIVFVKHSLLPE